MTKKSKTESSYVKEFLYYLCCLDKVKNKKNIYVQRVIVTCPLYILGKNICVELYDPCNFHCQDTSGEG